MMAEEITRAVDLGTTGIKAAAFDEHLHCLGSFQVENRLYCPAPGLVEHVPDYCVGSALGFLQRLANRLGDAARRVVAIVCSGQMGDVVGINAEWRAVGHFDAVLDPRSSVSRILIEPFAEHILRRGGGGAVGKDAVLARPRSCGLCAH